MIVEEALRTISVAVNEERHHFAEICTQALLAMEYGDNEWARILLLTGRGLGLGGPLELMHGEVDDGR